MSCPYNVIGRYDTGYGYGTSSHVMLPSFTSVGVGGGVLCAKITLAHRTISAATGKCSLFFIARTIASSRCWHGLHQQAERVTKAGGGSTARRSLVMTHPDDYEIM